MNSGTSYVEHRHHIRPPDRSPPAAWPDTSVDSADDLERDACFGRRNHRVYNAELYPGAYRHELAGVSSRADHALVIPLLPGSVNGNHHSLEVKYALRSEHQREGKHGDDHFADRAYCKWTEALLLHVAKIGSQSNSSERQQECPTGEIRK
jgi:hypothetical protein